MMSVLYIQEKVTVFCDETFRSERSLRTHENIHWRENIQSSDIFNINSYFNHHQLYISRVDQGYVTDINEAVKYDLDFKKLYQIYHIILKSLLTTYSKREQLKQIKTGPVNLRTDQHMTRTLHQDLN